MLWYLRETTDFFEGRSSAGCFPLRLFGLGSLGGCGSSFCFPLSLAALTRALERSVRPVVDEEEDGSGFEFEFVDDGWSERKVLSI